MPLRIDDKTSCGCATTIDETIDALDPGAHIEATTPPDEAMRPEPAHHGCCCATKVARVDAHQIAANPRRSCCG